MLVVGTEHHGSMSVEDGDVELLHEAGTYDIESVVCGLVGSEDVGTIESKCVNRYSESAVDVAAHFIVSLHRNGIAVGHVNVEMVGNRFACGS